MRGLLGDDRAERVDAAPPPERRRMSAMRADAFRAATRPRWRERMAAPGGARAANLPSPPVEGSLTRMVGLALEASGCQAAVGDVCDLLSSDGSRCEAEVVGFAGDRLFLMPTGEVHGLAPSARVVPRQRAGSVRVGPGLLGRIIDGTGAPLDGLGPLNGDERVKLLGQTHQSAGSASPSTRRSTSACAPSIHCSPSAAASASACSPARASARACCSA